MSAFPACADVSVNDCAFGDVESNFGEANYLVTLHAVSRGVGEGRGHAATAEIGGGQGQVQGDAQGGARDITGLEKRPAKVCAPFQMLGLIEDDLREAIGIDVTPLAGRTNVFGFDRSHR